VGTGDDVLGTKRTVTRLMPVPDECGEPARQTVRHADLKSAAERATFPLGALQNRGLPLVVATFRTSPPHSEVTPSSHVGRGQVPILASVPLSSYGGEQIGERAAWLGLSVRNDCHRFRGPLR
jgi:hypothetical protein